MAKGRPVGDGRGRIGGRQKGTPNKDKPIKTFLREHSTEYFTPSIEEKDEDGKPTGRMLSQYDLDIRMMKPADRVNAELQLLKYHTPQMQATAVDLSMQEESNTLSERLALLSEGEDIPSPND